MTTIDTLKTLWTRTVREGDFSVDVIDVVAHDEDAIVTARTIRWDGGEVQDVREQEMVLGALDDLIGDDATDARNTALVDAWEAVVREVFGTMTAPRFDGVMPADLFFRDVAHLVTCTTQEQFEKALRAKKRLGQHLSS